MELTDQSLLSQKKAFNVGWGELAIKIKNFMNRRAVITDPQMPLLQNTYAHTTRECKWSKMNGAQIINQTEEGIIKIQGTKISDDKLLSRCLVGRFSKELDEIPTRNEVRKWISNKWSNAIGVYELNGCQFLFEFPTRRMAEEVLEGTWRWGKAILNLKWWTPTTACVPAEIKPAWVWVRIFGLSLYLWSADIMKAIGDKCGGWIETEEET